MQLRKVSLLSACLELVDKAWDSRWKIFRIRGVEKVANLILDRQQPQQLEQLLVKMGNVSSPASDAVYMQCTFSPGSLGLSSVTLST